MACRLRIGLTGGIGSGKSEVARQFTALGAGVIDTDIIARQLVEPGQPALTEIAAVFGREVLETSGRLDRDRLRRLVFADPARRKQLEDILHPRIRAQALQEADRTDAPYCLLVIPLLVETAADYQLDRILLVDCPEALQRQRIRARDALSDAEIDAILAAQANRAARQAVADDIILNDSDLQSLTVAVERLHRRYLALSAGRTPDRW
jgi:dephospho-CoA kinase